jgi:hypothetical protein
MAVQADVTAAYNSLLKTTLDNYRGKLVDNVFKKHVLSWLLMDKNRVRMLSGGEKITEHLMVSAGQAGNYDEWQSVDISPQGGITTASFPWEMLVSTIAISGLEEAKNSGKEAILSLLKARVQQSEKTLQRLINNQLWGISTGGFTSVLTAIDDTLAVGGITPNGTTENYWKSPKFAATAGQANTFALLNQRLTNLYNQASDGTDVVTALIGAQNAFELFELGLTPNVRYTDTKSASAGFTNLMFKGVPFYWDKAAPTGTVIGINPEYLTLVGHKDRWFKQSPFTASPIDGAGDGFGGAKWLDARYSVISTFGNLTISDRSKHFKLTGVGV